MANNVEKKAGKKTVLQFTAKWVPGEGEEEDGNCSLSGIIQVIGEKPTDLPAHVILRDYSDKTPCWWPAISVPGKKALSFGPEYGEEEHYSTNLHEVKMVKGAHITLKGSKEKMLAFEVVSIIDLTE